MSKSYVTPFLVITFTNRVSTPDCLVARGRSRGKKVETILAISHFFHQTIESIENYNSRDIGMLAQIAMCKPMSKNNSKEQNDTLGGTKRVKAFLSSFCSEKAHLTSFS